MLPLKKKKGRNPHNPHSGSELKALANAVEKLHGATALFVETEQVNEQFGGAIVWTGLVSRFELHGHPSATVCYAWSEPATSKRGQRFYAVLQTPEINSPEKAVRASIVADHKAT